MNVNTEVLETHEVKLSVTIEPEQFEDAKKRAAKQLSKKYKIPGFRPGKAPLAVVQKHLGDGAISEQAIENLINEVYPKAIEEADVSPYGPGSLEEMESFDPVIFNFLIPLAPEVELSNYRDLRVEFSPREVTEENIDEIIENLREGQAVIEAVDRPAEEGDMVYVVLSGARKGEEDPDEKLLLEERRYPVIIEKKDAADASEYPFPGFSRKLIGLSAGDNKKFQYTFKEDYEFEDLRGVTGIYTTAVEEIKGRKLPEVNDEFLASVGKYENLEALRQEIRDSLTQQFETEQISAHESEIIDRLVEDAAIKYPPQMLEDEIDDFIHDLGHQLEQQGLTMDLYLKSRSFEVEQLRDEVKETAEARMKRGLILMEVAKAEEIDFPIDELNKKVQDTLREIAAYYSEEDAKRLASGKNLENLVNRIASDEIMTRTVTRLRNLAMGITEEEEDETAAEAEAATEDRLTELEDTPDQTDPVETQTQSPAEKESPAEDLEK